MNKQINALELFSGAGGISLGLEKNNINIVANIEFNKYCCETLRKNRPQWTVIEDDIKNVDFKTFKDIDIVTGGFPCQAFSYAGKRLGFEDTRGTLFYEYARCLKEVKPKMFFAENVKGLLTHDNGKTFQTILNVFEEIGYNISYKILNAVYYNVPQKRERLIIIGIRKDINKEYIWPQPTKQPLSIKQALTNVPQSSGQTYSKRKKEIMELVPQGGNWRDLPIEIQKEYMGKAYYSGGGKTGIAKRLSLDAPSPTILCSPAQKQTERCHPIETRPLNIRECARIQTFPDEYEFCGSISEQYKQIGNAVPVNLAATIIKSMINILY